MPRRARSIIGGNVYHVLNRANGRSRLFKKKADFVDRAQDWQWGSLQHRLSDDTRQQAILTDSPVALGRDWTRHVNQPQTAAGLIALRSSVSRGRPFGNDAWCKKVAKQMGLEHTFRSRGRPRTGAAC